MVKELVKDAVKTEQTQIPTKIQNTANSRPPTDCGQRSPYLKQGKCIENEASDGRICLKGVISFPVKAILIFIECQNGKKLSKNNDNLNNKGKNNLDF